MVFAFSCTCAPDCLPATLFLLDPSHPAQQNITGGEVQVRLGVCPRRATGVVQLQDIQPGLRPVKIGVAGTSVLRLRMSYCLCCFLLCCFLFC